MLLGLLSRGHWRTRWKRYVSLSAAFGIGLLGFFAVLMVAEGARASLIEPLEATMTGPLRVTNSTSDLGAGTLWPDYRPYAARVSQTLHVQTVERLESNYITIRGNNYENWSAGLLLGIDPVRDGLVADHARFLLWGHGLDNDFAYAADGKGYVPIVIGADAAKRLNISLNASGEPDFLHPLTLTSGHTIVSGSVPIPVTLDAVVVGVFGTGLEPLDKFTAFMPIGHARFLAGFAATDPVANALLVASASPSKDAATVEGTLGLRAVTSEEFAFEYMGSMLVVIFVAGGLGLALFLLILLIWVSYETGTFIRRDQVVLCSLRAIGVPERSLVASYVALAAGAVGLGALAALAIGLGVGPLLPPIRWDLSGLKAAIELRPRPLWMLVVAVGSTLAAYAAALVTARRIAKTNILSGLRRA